MLQMSFRTKLKDRKYFVLFNVIKPMQEQNIQGTIYQYQISAAGTLIYQRGFFISYKNNHVLVVNNPRMIMQFDDVISVSVAIIFLLCLLWHGGIHRAVWDLIKTKCECQLTSYLSIRRKNRFSENPTSTLYLHLICHKYFYFHSLFHGSLRNH